MATDNLSWWVNIPRGAMWTAAVKAHQFKEDQTTYRKIVWDFSNQEPRSSARPKLSPCGWLIQGDRMVWNEDKAS